MSSAQQYMWELPSHSYLEQSASNNYKQNLQPPQITGKGLKNHWIYFFSCGITVSVIKQLNLIKHQNLIDAFHGLNKSTVGSSNIKLVSTLVEHGTSSSCYIW